MTLTAEAAQLSLTLRTRDPKTDEVIITPKKIDPEKIGIVIVDMWNYHWCMTWTEQAGGMTWRMNRALQGARKLGMHVFWGPTDAASMFSGWPQKQRSMAVPYVEVPKARDLKCKFTVPFGKCLCGPGINCITNYGWDGMVPELDIADQDLIVSGTQELYSHCKARGITHLIYFGGATNICLTGKDIGLGPMYRAGLDTIFARDLAFAWTHYDPAASYTPSTGNAQAADDLERGGIPTIFMADELRKRGLWNDAWITEPVRITPAGSRNRPYFFEETVSVSLDVPYLEGADIRYTLDGSEPSPSSARFEKPVVLNDTTTLRTAAFRAGKKATLDGQAYFVHMPPRPPEPDVRLDELESVSVPYARHTWQPKTNLSHEGKPLRVRRKTYENGIGMRAPAFIRYDLKQQWKRFVALAGVDENLLDAVKGKRIARYPSIVFKVYLDGNLSAESPVMRISQEPWRFDVPIRPATRQIVLVCDDAGSRGPYDLGNWVQAGFCTNKDKD
jgi:hypothetical protein